jgi:hypothetical protein
MSSATRAQRCATCDGIQPVDRKDCEICGEPLRGESVVTVEPATTRRFERERAAPHADRSGVPSPRAGRRFERSGDPARKTVVVGPRFPAGRDPSRAGPKRTKAGAKSPPRDWSWLGARPILSSFGRAVAATACATATLIALAALLTFRVPGAPSGDVAAAAAEATLVPTIIAGLSWWILALFRRTVRTFGRTPTPLIGGGVQLFLAVGAGTTALAALTDGFANSYVPPRGWVVALSFAVAVPAVSAVAEGLRYASSARSAGVPLVVGRVGLAALLAATFWSAFLASREVDAHTAPSQSDEQALVAAVPLANCATTSVATPNAPVLTDITRAVVTCREGRLSGTFVWFRSTRDLRMYAGFRARPRGKRAYQDTGCASGPPHLGPWQYQSEPDKRAGQLLCTHNAGVRRIEWSDETNGVYAVVRGRRPLRRLYRWWGRHLVAPVQ